MKSLIKKIIAALLILCLLFTISACEIDLSFLKDSAPDDESSEKTNASIPDNSALLGVPARLNPVADKKNDPVSIAALLGTWDIISVSGHSWLTNYAGSSGGSLFIFNDDGTFTKIELMQFTSSSISYGYYYTYPTGSYQFTTQGKYKIKGGVIEFYNAASSNKSGRDWNDMNANPDGPWSPIDDWNQEFEFLDSMRLRLRYEDGGSIIYKWSGESHNVTLPSHEIPAVDWPSPALSAEMPKYTGTGRVRETRLQEYGEDENAPEDIYKTVYITIDRENENSAPEYAETLRKAGWYINNDSIWGINARKGFYTVSIDFGEPDELKIESRREVEGKWFKDWAEAGIIPPENSPLIGQEDISDWEKNKAESLSVYQEFDKINEAAANEYLNKMTQNGYILIDDDWRREVYKYLWLDGRLYRVSIEKGETYGEITEMKYYLRYYDTGEFPVSWINTGINPPQNEAIAEKLYNIENFGNISDGRFYESYYAKFLGVSPEALSAYFDNLESQGFTAVISAWSNYREVYKYMRVDGKMYKVTVYDTEGSELAEVCYRFEYFEDGEWFAQWTDAGLNPPQGAEIAGAIDLSEWGPNEDGYSYDSYYIKFTGLSDTGLDLYFNSLEQQGFTEVEDDWSWSDARQYFAYMRIGGDMYKVTVTDEQNSEIAEIRYSFEYYKDGVWQKDKIPPDIIPPDGVQFLGEIEVYNDSGEYGSFRFSCIPFDDIAAQNYKDKLKNNGWTLSEWSDMYAEKTVTWQGGTYECSISLSDISDGKGEYSVSFSKR